VTYVRFPRPSASLADLDGVYGMYEDLYTAAEGKEMRRRTFQASESSHEGLSVSSYLLNGMNAKLLILKRGSVLRETGFSRLLSEPMTGRPTRLADDPEIYDERLVEGRIFVLQYLCYIGLAAYKRRLAE
jgi:hypothetical protein